MKNKGGLKNNVPFGICDRVAIDTDEAISKRDETTEHRNLSAIKMNNLKIMI